MNTFFVAFFLLLSQVASAEFGADAVGLKRRHLLNAESTLDMTVRRAKSVKSKNKKSTKGKNKSMFSSADIGDIYSMSFSMPTFSQPTKKSSGVTAKPKSKGAEKPKGAAKSKNGLKEKSANGAKSQPPKSKGAEKSKAPAKSKEGEMTRKSIDFTKLTRSSLNPTEAGVEQAVVQAPETAYVLTSANAESGGFVYGINGAFLVTVSFLAAGAFIVA